MWLDREMIETWGKISENKITVTVTLENKNGSDKVTLSGTAKELKWKEKEDKYDIIDFYISGIKDENE